MSVKERRNLADYLNVGTEATPEFALMGIGFTELDEEPSAQTTTKKYINMSSASSSITGYEWSSAFVTDIIPDEKAIDFICNIGERELTGAATETDYIKVDLDKKVGDEYEAKKRTVAIEITNFKSNDGEMQASGNLKAKTDWVFGKFDAATKTFTPEA